MKETTFGPGPKIESEKALLDRTGLVPESSEHDYDDDAEARVILRSVLG